MLVGLRCKLLNVHDTKHLIWLSDMFQCLYFETTP